MTLFSWIYAIAVMGMAVYGFNLLLLLALAVWGWCFPRRPATAPAAWPTVLVQLPIFNERYVVERIIDAVAALDYPADRLFIQVLDDSTDDTAAIARRRAAYQRQRGRNITYLHRADRTGFKAGALAEGLKRAPGEFVAVFDADFVPPADFLRRTIPEFLADARVGVVQTRWDHLNAEENPLTRAQAISIDSHFGVEQVARSGAGLMFNFNGSGGLWRRAAIEDAGGWQSDTLVEDLDLSYRAQLKGWLFRYLPEVVVPAEIPASVMAFKRQQFRWAKGTYQVLFKLWWRLLTARTSLWRKVQAILHLGGYLGHPFMVMALLLSLPVVLARGYSPVDLNLLGLAGLGPPLVGAFSQLRLRPDWPKRLLYYPMLILLGFGLSVNNTAAFVEAIFSRRNEFIRTPKAAALSVRENIYTLPVDWTTWAELFLALYAAVVCLLAAQFAPALVPYTFLNMLGLGYMAGLGFWQSGALQRRKGLPAAASK